MKKFFAFVAAALVAFSFASCKPGEGGKSGEEPENEAYKIEISNITTKGALIKVTPADTTVTYYWDVVTAVEAAKMEDEAVGKYFLDIFEEAVEYYKQAGYDVTVEDFLLHTEDSYEYTSLDANTEYTVLAIAVDAKGVVSGKSVRKSFKTLEPAPVVDDMTFEIAVDGITYASAAVAVTPSREDATYYWNIFAKTEIASMSDAELCAAIKENIDYMIEYYGYFGYEVTYDDFLSQGPDAYEYDELDSNTEYVVIAVAMDTEGNTGGAVAKKNFQTAELVPESEETLEFQDAIAYDYRQLDGSFQIIAAPEDSAIVIALNPYSDDLAGSFTKDDLDPEYSWLVNRAEEQAYDIASAEFTGEKVSDEEYTYTGWFVATNLVKYHFTFNAVVEEGEVSYAPAKAVKKAPAKKEPKLLKKGNLKKNAKRSEKLFNL